MRIFTNNYQKSHCKNLNEPCSTSRFLIPDVHLELLQEKLTKHDNSLTAYLSYLLDRYRFLVKNGIIPKHEYLKTGYQKKDLNLKKIDFVPKAEDWAELKCLRSFYIPLLINKFRYFSRKGYSQFPKAEYSILNRKLLLGIGIIEV